MAQVDDRRWVVAFAGTRDSYQVPIALHESGLLQSLATDFYAPFDRVPFAQANKLLPSICTKLDKRFDSALPSRFVQSDSAMQSGIGGILKAGCIVSARWVRAQGKSRLQNIVRPSPMRMWRHPTSPLQELADACLCRCSRIPKP